MRWSVCIFAHNEERALPQCVAALDAAAGGRVYVAHVVENGSTDATARVARTLAVADPRLRVHELALGDKANAWNEYVHRLAPDADVHFFLDGDVRPCAGAFEALGQALAAAPEAYAAAALPAAGRTRRAWASRLVVESWLSGNLYALSAAALAEFRRRGLRLPIGAFGEDGLLSYIFRTNFAGGEDDGHRYRIAIADDAHFEFDSLTLRRRDLATYRQRLRRYSQRYFQNEILYRKLKAGGLAALPEHVRELFTIENLKALRPRIDLQFFFPDLSTLRRLRTLAQARESKAPHRS